MKRKVLLAIAATGLLWAASGQSPQHGEAT